MNASGRHYGPRLVTDNSNTIHLIANRQCVWRILQHHDWSFCKHAACVGIVNNDITQLILFSSCNEENDKIKFPFLNTEITSCAHKWGQYTSALITTHLIQKYPIKISILQSCATQVEILQEQIWIEPIVFFQKVPETPFSPKYLATRGPKMRLGTRKCIGV